MRQNQGHFDGEKPLSLVCWVEHLLSWPGVSKDFLWRFTTAACFQCFLCFLSWPLTMSLCKSWIGNFYCLSLLLIWHFHCETLSVVKRHKKPNVHWHVNANNCQRKEFSLWLTMKHIIKIFLDMLYTFANETTIDKSGHKGHRRLLQFAWN